MESHFIKNNIHIFKLLMDLPINASFFAGTESKSMFPLIKEGDKVLIRKTDTKFLKKGDIICFYNTKLKRLVIHRIINKFKNNVNLKYTTKGDNNIHFDQFIVDESKIIGQAIMVQNKYYSYTLMSIFTHMFRLNFFDFFPFNQCKTFIRITVDIPLKLLIFGILARLSLLK
jgi:signal peptidase I